MGSNNKKKHNGGRPETIINWKEFEAQCALQCTEIEIADYFNCSVNTILRKVKEHYQCCFVDIFRRKRQKGLMSLRANLFKLSGKQGNVTIFCAKNWLGMSDKMEIANPPGESFRVDHDPKSKLISLIDRLAARTGETEGDKKPDSE